MVTYLDGRFVEDADANISVRSRALNYGLGCFGGIRGYLADDGKQVLVFRLDAHVERLLESARVLYLRAPAPAKEIADLHLELLRKNDVHFDVYIRPLLLHNSTAMSPVLDESSTSFAIYCLPLKRY